MGKRFDWLGLGFRAGLWTSIYFVDCNGYFYSCLL